MLKNALLAVGIAVLVATATAPATAQSPLAAAQGTDVDTRKVAALINPALQAAADAVIHGTVTTIDYRVTETGGVETVASVSVQSTLRGVTPGSIVLTVRGGRHPDGMVHRSSHSPWLESGDEIVAALISNPDNSGRYLVEAEASVAHISSTSFAALPGTFTLNGVFWEPYPAAGVSFEINPNAPGVSPADTLAAVRSAFRTWEDDPYSDLRFDDQGTTSRLGGVDARNVVSWTPEPLRSESWLAVTDSYFLGDRLAEVDITFNTAYRWSTSPRSFESDIQSTALHEVGHFIGLDHIDISSAVMFRSIQSGVRKRTLTENETAGAAHLYPRLCAGKPVTIAGTDAAETLYGTAGDDVIAGGGGNDILAGGAGRDTICGEGGDDTLRGGSWADRLLGGPGRDRIYGEGAGDHIEGGPDIDRIWGGDGNDTIIGDGGSDRIYGNGGNDTIAGGSGADRIWGGDGDDQLNGNGGQDFMWGDAGRDTIQGNFQSDELHGGPGRDIIRGAGGKDTLFGDADNDDLNGGANSDTLWGGGGFDIVNGGPGRDTCDANSGDALVSC